MCFSIRPSLLSSFLACLISWQWSATPLNIQTLKTLSNPLPHPDQMFSMPNAKPTFDNACGLISVVQGGSIKRTPNILSFFTLLIQFSWEPFLFISEDIYELVTHLLYPNLPPGFWNEEIFLKSSVLGVPIEFSVLDKFDLLSHTKPEIYSTLFNSFTPGSKRSKVPLQTRTPRRF